MTDAQPKLLDVVVLLNDVGPDRMTEGDGLTRGNVGTVVEIHGNGAAFEVEFVDRSGRTYGLVGLRADEVLLLQHERVGDGPHPVASSETSAAVAATV
jgi:hypothetical protein